AGEAATLRGMELAVRAGFDVRIVPLPAGVDPAEAVDGFAALLDEATGYLLHRVRLEIERAPDRQEAFNRAQAVIALAPAGPDQEQAAQYASDRLDVPLRVHAASGPTLGQARRKLLEAGERLERDFLAVCAVRPELGERYLHDLDDRHLDHPLHRRLRAYLAGEIEADAEILALRAELDATAASEGLDEASAKELFLRLEERVVRRELAELGWDDARAAREAEAFAAEAAAEGVVVAG
ncbi:MAG: hypothetical protein ACRDPC_23230, partial [Solirubrobacteraceae bacterium]